jgi:hypothetical protein
MGVCMCRTANLFKEGTDRGTLRRTPRDLERRTLMARNWREVHAEASLDESAVAAERARLLAEAHAHRLAEVSARHQLTQEQLAARIGGLPGPRLQD